MGVISQGPGHFCSGWVHGPWRKIRSPDLDNRSWPSPSNSAPNLVADSGFLRVFGNVPKVVGLFVVNSEWAG